MFATVYYVNGKNRKEKEVNEWLLNKIDGTLLSGYEAWISLCRTCMEKASELDRKYPRTRPLSVGRNALWGFPYCITVGDSGSVHVVEVKHEIEEDEVGDEV